MPINLRDASHEVSNETHTIEIDGNMLLMVPRGPGHRVRVPLSAIQFLMEV